MIRFGELFFDDRSKTILIAAVLAFCISFSVSRTLGACSDDCQQELYEQYTEQRQSRIKLESQLNACKDDYNEIDNDLNKYGKKIRHLEEAVHQCQMKIQKAQNYIDSLENANNNLGQDLQHKKEYIQHLEYIHQECVSELEGHGTLFNLKLNLFGGALSVGGGLKNPLSSHLIESDSNRRRHLRLN